MNTKSRCCFTNALCAKAIKLNGLALFQIVSRIGIIPFRQVVETRTSAVNVQLQQVHLAYTQLFWTNPQIERKNSEFKTILTKRKRIQNTLKFGSAARLDSTKSEVRPAHPVLGVS
ncbi:Hypothetical_protein [Hexamita inflata]|uniref:Hypothetical_protein n=1 Tax=Hexamita inflata TaxID=28002 RepID=A0AA86NRM7_9EUKA|nr:Hypothetical protein HINF_LOCUS11195 [Hexamita inflata]